MSARKRTQIARHPVLIAVDNYRALKVGRPALQSRQHERLPAMVEFARAKSPFYRERYRELPASGFALEGPAAEASELSYDCDNGWHHLHADWFAFEPVDAEFRPVAPGEPSHTVLLTNLINRTQPILRYDLGDSIVMRPDPCPCGNPLPAFLATGRSSDVLRLSTSDGTTATIAPMTLTTALEPVLGASRYQIVQTAPDGLAVRFTVAEGTDTETTWRAMVEALREVLAKAGLAEVSVQRDPEPPAQTAGGKYRAVIPLSG